MTREPRPNLPRPRHVRHLLALAAGLLLGACSSQAAKHPDDPWEGMNRAIYNFNEDFDNAITRPVARGYRAITPEFVDIGISNFFSNLGDVPNALNNLLQGKPLASLSDIGRLGINSTVGLAGLIDVASHLGLERHNEDLGQTLAVWGVGDGYYLVLPFLGPSNVRDGIGWVGDFQSEPYYYLQDRSSYYGNFLLDVIDTRADLLGASRILEQASLDPYTFHRETYIQRRKGLVYDGNPPLEGPSAEELDLLNDLDIIPAK